MYEFKLTFKTPQGLISYQVHANHYIEAVSKARKENDEVKEYFPLTAIRRIYQ